MSLLEWCDEGPATVSLLATVEDAVRTMLDKQVGAVAVIDPTALETSPEVFGTVPGSTRFPPGPNRIIFSVGLSAPVRSESAHTFVIPVVGAGCTMQSTGLFKRIAS